MRAFVFGAVHLIGLSPVLSSELVINVPSTFDTNIYTAHKHPLGNPSSPPNPLPCASRKVAEHSVRHGPHRDVIRRQEEGNGEERRGEGGRRRGEAASSVSSEIGVTGLPEPLFLHRDWELKRRLGEREMGENLNDKTRRG